MEDPVDSTPLQAAMDAPITASLGSMGPLLRQLHSLTNRRPEGVSEGEFQLLKEDLQRLCIALNDVAKEEDPSTMAKCWMKMVRELCYDAENYFDELIHFGAGDGASSIYLFLKRGASSIYRVLPVWIYHKVKRHPQIANDFSELKARVEEASKRETSFQSGRETMKTCSGLSLQLPVPTVPMEDRVELLAFDDDREKQLKVVTIFDFAGVGKTSVARTLYHQYRGKFQCRAFLRLSRNQDIRRLLTSILSQIKAPPAHAFSDAQILIDSIREHLQGKSYFIIINDLWTPSVWDTIRRAFPDDYCRSRIIITTQIKDVMMTPSSYHLKYILERDPFNDGQPGKLFSDRVSSSEGGITSPTPEEMKRVMNRAYNNLPPHLKTCLLYLSMHPEGYTIRKDELVKQWVAEGFLGAVGGQDRERDAGVYFDELVSKGMIEPVDTNYNGEVLSCTVHNMVLDLIRDKSMEENFITTVDYSESPVGLVDEVRRLSIQFGGVNGAKVPESIRTSQVRSLLFCGFSESVPSIVEYRLLRVLVLHIWADQDKASFDLSGICELLLLRYLKIVCNITVKLPAKIQGMKYLETLEVDAREASASLPTGIDRMTSLRTLGYFDLSSNSEDDVKDLAKLTNLQDLHLTCSTLQPDSLEKQMKCVVLILRKPRSLRCLTLVPAGSSHGNNLDDADASSMSISCDALSSVGPAPALLQRLELSPRICVFARLPTWFGCLHYLCILKIAVRELSNEDADSLKGLPVLTALSLYVWIPPPGLIFFGKEDFLALRYFKFTSTALYLSFAKGALPRVQRLKLRFNANTSEQYDPVSAGFEHLLGLEEISAKIGSSVGSDESHSKAAEYALKLKDVFSKHPKSPSFDVQSVDYIFHSDKHKRGDSRTSVPREPSSCPGNTGGKTKRRPMDVHPVKTVRGIRNAIIKQQMNLKFIQREMELMTIMIEENKEDDLQEKWVMQLQELVYDIEDFICNYSRLSIRSPLRTLVRMKHLKNRTKSLRKLQQTSKSSHSEASAGHSLSETPCYTPEADLVGIAEPKTDLLELLSPADGQLRVISIVGCSGLGKTALARALYDDHHVYSAFHRRAWVVASECNNAGDLLNKITQQLNPHAASKTTPDYNLLRQILHGTRYFVVIDQVQRAEMWHGIEYAFPKYDNGSRIIVTTSIQSVAAAAAAATGSTGSYLYTMSGLGDADSKTLFWKKFYGRDTEPAPGLADGSESIFRKCDGLPLSLLSTASYLRRHHRTGRIGRFGSYSGVAPEALGEMNRALVQCYNSLPDNGHRTCLLSLSIYPQGHQINRKSVIRRWVAEGLVAGNAQRTEEEVAGDRFDELIDRNIIEPVLISNNSKVKRCRVHGVKLEFIVNKAISKNFVTLIRKDEPIPNKKGPGVRRLSVQDGTAVSGRIATETGLSVIRSLTIFKSELFNFQRCKLLRVLDLEGCNGLDDIVLDAVCQLLHLKYLSLRGSDVGSIPKRIRRLHHLETLDLRETKVNKLPMQVMMLPRLAHLFGQFELPQELKDGMKKSKLDKFLSEESRMQTLSGFFMDENSGSVPIVLQMRSLRKVAIWCRRYSNVQSEELLVSSLQKRFTGSSALESLSIDLDNYAPDFLHFLKDPCELSSIKLRGQLGRLPNFITSPDTTISELQLSSTSLSSQELSLLQNLRCLLYLKLYEDQWELGDGIFQVQSGGFPSLERLCIEAPKIPELHIQAGAMIKLTALHLLGPEYAPTRVEGIEHLQRLNEVVLHDSVDADGLEAWKKTAMQHQNRPKVTKQ